MWVGLEQSAEWTMKIVMSAQPRNRNSACRTCFRLSQASKYEPLGSAAVPAAIDL